MYHVHIICLLADFHIRTWSERTPTGTAAVWVAAVDIFTDTWRYFSAFVAWKAGFFFRRSADISIRDPSQVFFVPKPSQQNIKIQPKLTCNCKIKNCQPRRCLWFCRNVLRERIFWRPGWRMWPSDWFLPLSVICKSNYSYDLVLLLVQECKYCTDTSSTASQEGGRRLNTNWIPADGASQRSVSVLQTHSDSLDEILLFCIIGWRASASVLVSSFGINHTAAFF